MWIAITLYNCYSFFSDCNIPTYKIIIEKLMSITYLFENFIEDINVTYFPNPAFTKVNAPPATGNLLTSDA